VLVVARSYPSEVLPTLGLWTERPTRALNERCDVRVVSPVPYCPPLPSVRPLLQYTRFRHIPSRDVVNGVQVIRPRYAAGPATTLYALEPAAWSRALAPAVDRLYREWPFDLVHAHLAYPEGVAAARIARRFRVPLVISEHAPWEPWLRRFGVARQVVPAARTAAALLPVSTSVRDTMLGYLGSDAPPLDVVPPGVDGAAFPLGEAPRPRRILFVGLLNFNKGLDVLFEALALLKGRGDPVALTAVGGSHYRNTRLQEERIRRLPEALGIADRVEFTGSLEPSRVASLMREHAVLVLPSRAESFGSVLVEALASGTPVVATRCGGPEDIVRDDVGRLVPVGDPPALADALASVLDRSQSYAPDALRRFALERFGLDRIVERIHEHYLALLPGERAAA